jgi:hypothetical protein
MLSLTVFHQGTVQLGVRKMSLAIILLDFDAIADEFGGLHRCVVARQTSWACVGEPVMARARSAVFRIEDWIRI